MPSVLPYALATLVSGLAAVWGKDPSRMVVHWIAKPLTMGLIIAATLVMPTRLPANAFTWLMVALACSLVGDICLMFKEKLFVAGLVAFLMAHVAYLACFAIEAPSFTSGLAYLAIPVPVALWVGRQLWPHLGKLRPAVVIYIVALVLVAWRLLARFTLLEPMGLDQVSRASCLYSAAGGLLFVLSDSILSLRHFAKRQFPYIVELGAYFGAQWCIASATWSSGIATP